MRLLIVGGRLQGTEAAYLAREAGFETVLVDRDYDTPASGLVDEVVVADVTADEALTRRLVIGCDAVLPACESLATLEWLCARVPRWDVPLLFDLDAYRVTRSKAASRRLFAEAGVTCAPLWPQGGLPAIVKPDCGSGSQGVSRARTAAEVAAARSRLAAAGREAVVESFVGGPMYSLEVVAGVPLLVTALEFDGAYDCKRVWAPTGSLGGATAVGLKADAPTEALGALAGAVTGACGLADIFSVLANRLVTVLATSSVFDIEVVQRFDGELVVLEVDARLPSQTPTVVWHAGGVNIVEQLLAAVRGGSAQMTCRRGACVYQHVRAAGGWLEAIGEHHLATARPLVLRRDQEEGVTVLRECSSASEWVATVIVEAKTLSAAQERSDGVLAEMATFEGLSLSPDLVSW